MVKPAKKFGKRELNKAKTKLDLLKAMQDLILEKSFRELKTKDIAKKAGVSEMTFFNYFQTKNDLLLYFMAVWTIDMFAIQLREPLKGEAAIHRIFAETAQQIKDNPSLMMVLIGYISSLAQAPLPMNVLPAERFLRHPDLELLHFKEDACADIMYLTHLAEIGNDFDANHVLLQILSAFYGDALVAHTCSLDVLPLYQNSLERIFKEIR